MVSKIAWWPPCRAGRRSGRLDGVLTLQVLRNSGAAFSIGTSMTSCSPSSRSG